MWASGFGGNGDTPVQDDRLQLKRAVRPTLAAARRLSSFCRGGPFKQPDLLQTALHRIFIYAPQSAFETRYGVAQRTMSSHSGNPLS